MHNNLLMEPATLSKTADLSETVLIDVTTAESYSKHHIPGAIFFDYRHLVSGIAPSPGTLPAASYISERLSRTGISKDKTIIAYDDEGNGKACRLLWTLDLLGFDKLHLINGGLHAWLQSSLGLEQSANLPTPSALQEYEYNSNKIADKSFILENINNPQVVIWDTRTKEEYQGVKPRANRNGHIPGAVNLNWLETIDMQNGLRFKPRHVLKDLLQSKGITPDKTIVPHCHTHHRSAHSSILLKYLDYEHVRAYPGSWSEWGNSTDTPIEQ